MGILDKLPTPQKEPEAREDILIEEAQVIEESIPDQEDVSNPTQTNSDQDLLEDFLYQDLQEVAERKTTSEKAEKEGEEEKPEDETNSDKSEEPNFKLDPLMVEATVGFLVDQLDIYLPKLSAHLQRVESPEQFQASKEELSNIKKYATIVANKYNNLKLSPEQMLLLSVGMAYGIPIIVGIKQRIPDLFGKISRKFENQAKSTANTPNKEPYTKDSTNHTPNYTTNTPESTNIHQDTQTKDTGPTRNCLAKNCTRPVLGVGVPAKSKKYPELQGQFCSRSCFTKYGNSKGLFGRGVKSKNDE